MGVVDALIGFSSSSMGISVASVDRVISDHASGILVAVESTLGTNDKDAIG